jgi:AraC-like DNA-binding protein
VLLSFGVGMKEPPSRCVAATAGFSMHELVCRAGPRDRPLEERHDHFIIAVVAGGSFIYKTEGGKSLLGPGALLLGNCGAGFECEHEHSTGDRCVSFRFQLAHFEELASSVTGSSRYRFPVGALPPIDALLPMLATVEAAAGGALESAMPFEELAVKTTEAVLRLVSGEPKDPPRSVAARDAQRISDILRYLEAHAAEPLELDELAKLASLSKYHFLRTFRSVVGRSPYQYLLTLRIRRAALELVRSKAAVSSIALDAGFGDLSTFNHRFRDVFGVSPRAFRERYRRRATS